MQRRHDAIQGRCAAARTAVGQRRCTDAAIVAAYVQAVALVDRREQRGVAPQAFRGPQQQVAAGLQRVMEGAQQTLLQFRIQVDQQVAARHQVHARERRVLDGTVRREHAHLADWLDHAPVVALLPEPAFLALRRNARQWRLVTSRARGVDRVIVDIGGEDLHPGGAALATIIVAHGLLQGDGDGIRLLAGGAAGHPDPQRIGRALVGQQLRDRGGLQRIEGLGVTEELGDPDQHFAEQGLVFFRMLAQVGDVVGHGLGLDHVHAALDAPGQGFFLVLAEVVADLGAQQATDRAQVRGQVLALAIGALVAVAELQMLLVRQQPRRHVLHRQDVVDQAGGGGTGRHPGHRRMVEARLG